MKKENDDAGSESVDKIEVLETFFDNRNDVSDASNPKNEFVQAKSVETTFSDSSEDEGDGIEAEMSVEALMLAIKVEHLANRASKLLKLITEIGIASEISDNKVRQHLLESKDWDSEVGKLNDLLTEIAMEAIGVDGEEEAVKNVIDIVEEVDNAVEILTADLKKEDEDRCLYSYSEPVQLLATYPPPFSGKPGEDFFKFKDKMLDTLMTNQVRKRSMVDILRQQLAGSAKMFLSEHCEDIDEAFEGLQKLYGVAWKIWESKFNNFLDRINKPETGMPEELLKGHCC